MSNTAHCFIRKAVSRGLISFGCLTVASSLFGAHDVSTVSELVTALTEINTGASTDTTVSIRPGVYDVSSCAMTDGAALYVAKKMSIIGSDSTSWRTTSDRNTKVVLDAGNKKCLLRVASDAVPTDNAVILRHLTFRNCSSSLAGAALHNDASKDVYATNCVYRNCTSSTYGGAANRSRQYDCCFTNSVAPQGGALYNVGFAMSCRFEDCHATSYGGIGSFVTRLYDSEVYHCSAGSASGLISGASFIYNCLCVSNSTPQYGLFTGSSSDTASVSVRNSTFIGNHGKFSGGVLYRPKIVEKCTFKDNWDGYGGANGVGGAVCGSSSDTTATLVTNCTFVGNLAGNGGAIAYCRAIACTFDSNVATNTGGAGYCCVVEDSTATNCMAGVALNACAFAFRSAIRRSTIVGCHCLTNESSSVVTDSARLEDCRIIGGSLYDNYSAVRCIFTGKRPCPPERLVVGGVLTNCLITGCSVNSYLFDGDSKGAMKLVNCTVVSNNHDSTGQLFSGTVNAWNCILQKNYNSTARGYIDIAGWGTYNLYNCCWSSHPGWATINETGHVEPSAKLFYSPGERGYDAEHPYKLRRSASAVDAGCEIGWAAAETDLAGAARVYKGRSACQVDVGCYEFCLPPWGMILMFR